MKQTKNEKGFSMIELIVVVAIMGIIGAVLIPQFSTMSARARITTDISTVKAVQQQIDVYQADMGKDPGTFSGNIDNTGIIEELVNAHYLDTKYLKTTDSLLLQTSGAQCVYDATLKHYILDIPNTDDLKPDDKNLNIWVK